MKLHGALGTVLAYTRSAEANAAWSKTLEIAEAVGEGDYQLRALHGMWTSTFSSGRLQQAQILAERYSALADRTQVSKKAGYALQRIAPVRIKGMMHFYKGELDGARKHLEWSLAEYEESGEGFEFLSLSIRSKCGRMRQPSNHLMAARLARSGNRHGRTISFGRNSLGSRALGDICARLHRMPYGYSHGQYPGGRRQLGGA